MSTPPITQAAPPKLDRATEIKRAFRWSVITGRNIPLRMAQHLAMLIVVLLLWSTISRAGSFVPDETAQKAIEGRWDITVHTPEKDLPAWLEVRHSGLETLVGQFVGAFGGSARPISRVEFSEGQLRFSIPPQWEKEKNDLLVEGRLQDNQLTGTMTTPAGKHFNWTASRAPSLRRTAAPTWANPISLIKGTNLTGWHALGENQWQVVDGVLRSPQSGSNLVTDQTFTDFKLHVEFRLPKGSNSGVYLRGRYEVQIADSEHAEPTSDQFSGLYGFLSPSEMMAKPSGEWQSFDITLVGRMVTVAANGKMVICNQEIPGITGGALDSNEGTPGPLLLQGDHGPIEYRNISITPAK